MKTESNQQKKIEGSGLVIYDGSCSGCSYFIEKSKGLFDRYGFRVAALQEPWVLEVIGLNEATLLQAIHLVTPDRKIFRGPEFFQYFSGRVWWLKPIYLVLKIPVFARLFSYIYYFIAKHRQRNSKDCGSQANGR